MRSVKVEECFPEMSNAHECMTVCYCGETRIDWTNSYDKASFPAESSQCRGLILFLTVVLM